MFSVSLLSGNQTKLSYAESVVDIIVQYIYLLLNIIVGLKIIYFDKTFEIMILLQDI